MSLICQYINSDISGIPEFLWPWVRKICTLAGSTVPTASTGYVYCFKWITGSPISEYPPFSFFFSELIGWNMNISICTASVYCIKKITDQSFHSHIDTNNVFQISAWFVVLFINKVMLLVISFVRKWWWYEPGIDSIFSLRYSKSRRSQSPHPKISMFSKSTKLSEKTLLNVNVNLQLKPRGRFRPKLCKFSKSTKLSIKSAFENVNFQFKTREEYFNSQSHYLHQMLRSINFLCVWCLNKQINSFWEILFAQSLCWVHSTQLPSSASLKTNCEHMCVG